MASRSGLLELQGPTPVFKDAIVGSDVGSVLSIRAHVVKSTQDVERTLSVILPPREYTDGDGTTWQQAVSTRLPEREDVAKLEAKLLHELRSRQARTAPLCPVREELFSEVFDEVLRQVTLECPERGLLLLRVRDELRMTLAAYNTIASYTASNTVISEECFEMEEMVHALETRKGELTQQVSELQAVIKMMESSDSVSLPSTTDASTARSLMDSELTQLREQNALLQSFLDDITGKEHGKSTDKRITSTTSTGDAVTDG